MKRFSRNMPPRPPDQVVSGWVLLSGVAILLGIVFVFSRPTFWILVGCLAVFVMGTVWLNRRTRSRLRQLADARKHDSICTFARTFPRHQVDPWIIRAVHEEVQAYLHSDIAGFPIRATDRPEDLWIDLGDFEDMVLDIARRVGRSTSSWEANPLYSKTYTLGDLVLLLNHQPRIPTA